MCIKRWIFRKVYMVIFYNLTKMWNWISILIVAIIIVIILLIPMSWTYKIVGALLVVILGAIAVWLLWPKEKTY